MLFQRNIWSSAAFPELYGCCICCGKGIIGDAPDAARLLGLGTEKKMGLKEFALPASGQGLIWMD
jgi:hypothetical protein